MTEPPMKELQRLGQQFDAEPHEMLVSMARQCTCHPQEAPKPCMRQFALSHCVGASVERAAILKWLRQSANDELASFPLKKRHIHRHEALIDAATAIESGAHHITKEG